MARKVWIAAELDKLTPAEVDTIFEASLVTDLDDVPSEFLAKVRADAQAHSDAAESSPKR